MTKMMTIRFFYSSEPFPSIEKWHNEVINHLNSAKKMFNYDLEIIDIRKKLKYAEKFKVKSTPALLISKQDGKEERYVGLINLNSVLAIFKFSNLAITHTDFYKKGRAISKKYKLHKLDRGALEAKLATILKKEYCTNVKLKKFNSKKRDVRITLISDFAQKSLNSEEPVDFAITGYLGGIFMEVFNSSVYFEETKCVAKGDKNCEFQTRKETADTGDLDKWLA